MGPQQVLQGAVMAAAMRVTAVAQMGRAGREAREAAIAWMEAWRAASQRATGSRPTAATDEADGRHSTGGGSVLPSPARAGLVQEATPGAGAAAAAGEGEEVDDGCLSDE